MSLFSTSAESWKNTVTDISTLFSELASLGIGLDGSISFWKAWPNNLETQLSGLGCC